MNSLPVQPVQILELIIGQPLLRGLFNQDQKQLHAKDKILSSSDEALLNESFLFRHQEGTK